MEFSASNHGPYLECGFSWSKCIPTIIHPPQIYITVCSTVGTIQTLRTYNTVIKNTASHTAPIRAELLHFFDFGLGFGLAVVPGPNVTAGGPRRFFGAPAIGCGADR